MAGQFEKIRQQNIRRRGSIAFRTISGIVMLLVIFALVVGYVGYERFTTSIFDQYSDGGILTAETAATIIAGGMEGMVYTDYQIGMPEGARLFLYTDGLPEAQNPDGGFFRTDRILDVLNAHKDASPEELLKEMSRAAESFEAGAPQFDDLTMLCIESRIKTEGEKENG